MTVLLTTVCGLCMRQMHAGTCNIHNKIMCTTHSDICSNDFIFSQEVAERQNMTCYYNSDHQTLSASNCQHL